MIAGWVELKSVLDDVATLRNYRPAPKAPADLIAPIITAVLGALE